MENSFQTSFIPKKPITTVSSVSSSKQPTSLFMLISVFILIVVSVSAGGLYFYKGYLSAQKKTLADSLLKSRARFEQGTIDELGLFDKRSHAVKKVLDGHIVLSPMFALLGSLTIPSIQYTKFDHKTTDQGFIVKMSGVARDYKSIALQADVFNTAKGRFFKNVVFSNLTKDKTNNVLFDIEFNVDPSLLSYEKDILANGSSSPKQSTSTTPAIDSKVTNPNNTNQ